MVPRLWGPATQLAAALRARTRAGDGQGLVEYAFIVMLIAILLIAIVTVIGHQTNTLFSNVSNAFPK